jgi:chromate transporter
VPSSLREIAALFLKLGTVAFGGPAAHIAMMEDEVVRRRAWLTREQFLDYLGATNLIPGPNSTELAIHIGHARAGWPGLLVAGVCFILPAALIVVALAWTYVRYGAMPAATGLLYGAKPAVIAVVAQALVRLGRTVLRTRTLTLVAAGCTLASLVGLNELALLFMTGVALALTHAVRSRGAGTTRPSLPALAWLPASGWPAGLAGAATVSAAAAPFGLLPLLATFVKIGSVLFGSGYVLVAFMRADFVDRLKWLTEQQLLDAVAVGQVTPGPVFTTATFVGYLVGGGAGAVVATVGIFLPAFVFVAMSGPLIPRLRRSPLAGAFLDGVNVASLALMATVTWQLGRVALADPLTIAIAVISVILLLRFRVSATPVIVGGALIGLVARALPG